MAVLVLLAILIIILIDVDIKMVREEGKPLRELNLARVEQLKRGPFTIYLLGPRSLGEEVADVLERAWRIARERLGVDLGRCRVAVVVPKASENLGGVSLRGKIWVLWNPLMPILTSPDLQSLQQAEADTDTLIAIYWVIAHEAMEMKIAKKLYRDRAARWVGDDLAEYMGYAITTELAPKVRDEMLARRRRNIQVGLLDHGRSHYDLTKEFLVKRGGKKGEASEQRPAEGISDPGYAVSLAFCLQIAQKHGEGVIKEFWQRLSRRGFPNAKEAARILSELTGEDIWAKLQKMDLREVLQTLGRAAGTP